MKLLLGILAVCLSGSAAAAVASPSRTYESSFTSQPETAPDAAVASPDPSPPPDDALASVAHWQVAAGFAVQRFRSKPITRTLYGAQATVTYLARDWFGIDANISGNCWCDGVRFNGEKVKFVAFNAGPRLIWNRPQRIAQPWVHALLGGIIVYPQTASGSTRGFASQLGGGVDFRLKPALSIRLQSDYIRSQLYSGVQHNLQLGAGIVVHF